jgi:hypothetical protein
MRGLVWGFVGIMAVAGMAGAETVQELHEVAGHKVALVETDAGNKRLVVDGQPLHEDGLILLDPQATVAGETVLSGVAGAGGNACNAAPFVLLLPQGAPARLDGPLDSCAWLERQVQPGGLVFASEALPGVPAEIWTWTPAGGFAAAPPEEFAPDAAMGWDALPALAGAHPAKALKLAPVYAALQGGLDAAWAEFAERITGLGSGDLLPGGYRGEACIKPVCASDFAVLWVDEAGQGIYAYWRVDGKGWVWPADTKTWPHWVAADLQTVLQR